MKNQKETEERISQLQLIEQNSQNLLMQRQNFQAQLFEINSALEEVKKTKDKIYKIIGPIMVAVEKQTTESNLNSLKEIIEIKIKSFEKQEAKLREKAEELQKEILKEIKNKNE